MKLGEKTEEVLETLWEAMEDHQQGLAVSQLERMGISKESLDELAGSGLVRMERGLVRFTRWGLQHSQSVIRRHRLAERLFSDVVEADHHEMEQAACRMEHLLKEAMEEKVCRLLGHPTTCPHGKPIPPGPCCQCERKQEDTQVVPLSKLHRGDEGQIAYLSTHDSAKIQKLLAMGVLPGNTIRVERTFPSFVFSVGYSQFAVDKETARLIQVKRPPLSR
jgi:DtxR family Mn-dependent transcriptional regulator